MVHDDLDVLTPSDQGVISVEIQTSESLEEGSVLEDELLDELETLENILITTSTTNSLQQKLNKSQLVSLCILKLQGELVVHEKEVKAKLANRLAEWVSVHNCITA